MDVSRRDSAPLWYGPAIMLGSFVAVFATFLWLVHDRARTTGLTELAETVESVGANLRLRLKANEDYLLLLARERADGSMNAGAFQERASRYVADHPEMICINWVNADFRITDVAPIAPNRHIVGLRLDLPEPKRASRLAMERRQPVYTHPFVVIQGKISVETWVPVFRGDTFLGVLGGIYSCEAMLHHLVPAPVLDTSQVSLVNAAGEQLLRGPSTRAVDSTMTHEVFLTPRESGLLLRLTGYRREGMDWAWLSLELLCLALVVTMSRAMWVLKREAQVRSRAKQSLKEHNCTLRGIIDNSSALIFSVDNRYRYTAFNHAHASMMKAIYGAEIAIGHSLLEYMTVAEDRETARTNLDRALAGEHLVEEAYSGDEQRSRRYFRVSHNPIADEEGKIIGVAVLSHDVTERKRAEDELLRFNEELEQRVKERTDELERTNRQLETFNRVFVGRELRMIQLKNQVRALESGNAAAKTTDPQESAGTALKDSCSQGGAGGSPPED